jgi:hypothetical protein
VEALPEGQTVHGHEGVALGVFFHVWTVRGGKIVRHEAFFDKSSALEAAGLKR